MDLKDLSPELAILFAALPVRMQNDIKDFLQDNPWFFICSRKDMVDAYLQWNDIFGYTDQIIDAVVAVMKPVHIIEED